MGYAQQQLTVLTIFLLVFTHKRTQEQQFLVTMSTTTTTKERYINKPASLTTSASTEENMVRNQ